MNPTRRIAIFAVITLSVGLSTARSESKAESKAEKRVEDNFKVSWTRISYNKTVSISSTFVPEDQKQDVSEGLSLECEVDILDPNLVLGTSRSLMIEEMIDEKGEDIAIDSRSSGSFRMSYEAPRFDRKFLAPTRSPKWKSAVRSALKLPPRESSRPQWVEQIRPSRMQIQLDVDMNKRAGGQITRAEGYFYALVADSFEYVDVPFKKSDKWIRLTPDLEIQIDDAWCRGSSFRVSTKRRPERGSSMHSLSPESYLPARMVVNRQFVNEEGKARNSGGFRRLPFSVSGSSSGSGGFEGTIKKIRFTIAVNPTHYEIPFVLEDIPLPKP